MGKKVNIDLTGIETFQRAAEGIHNVKIATVEVKQSQGGNDMIVISFEVIKGADKGARVYENFPLVDTALWKLKTLLESIGMKAEGRISLDLDRLVGKVCAINVIHEEYDGKIRARVESIMKIETPTVSDEDEDEDDIPFEEEEEEPKPTKKKAEKPAKKKAPINPPVEEDDEDEDEDDWDDEEEEEEKPVKKEKPSKKPEKSKPTAEKKPAKKSKDEDEDDWDDEDEDWDEA